VLPYSLFEEGRKERNEQINDSKKETVQTNVTQSD
jgi:hypothetical protein